MRAQKQEIYALTGLRGIAALLVVATHYAVWCSPYEPTTRPYWLIYLFGDGVIGMTLFFALSGFVITYNYIDLPWRGALLHCLWRFAVARLSRLYPALLLFFALLIYLQGTSEKPWILLHLFSLQSWVPAQLHGVFADRGRFHVSWSISTEIGFYVLFAAGVIVWAWMQRFGTRTAAVVMAVLIGLYLLFLLVLGFTQGVFVHLAAVFPGLFEPIGAEQWRRWFFHLSPYGRMFEFLCGSMAALVVVHYRAHIRRYKGPLSILAAIAAFGTALLFTSFYWPSTIPVPTEVEIQVAAAMLFGLVFLNTKNGGALNRALSVKPLLFVGNVSYSLYLFHFLMPRFFAIRYQESFSWPLFPYFLLNLITCVVAALVTATIVYHVVERPAQRMLRKVLQPRSISAEQGLDLPRA